MRVLGIEPESWESSECSELLACLQPILPVVETAVAVTFTYNIALVPSVKALFQMPSVSSPLFWCCCVSELELHYIPRLT